jgi:signal transduction histidine kinase
MKQRSLESFLISRKETIIRELNRRVGEFDHNPFWDWVINTAEGKQRQRVWVELVIGALGNDQKQFLDDQVSAGYHRASQGFEFERVSDVYILLQDIIKDVTNRTLRKNPSYIDGFSMNSIKYAEVFLRGHIAIATSYMKTREEIISKKVLQLQDLYDFTMLIITTMEIDKIAEMTLSSISANFKISESHLLVSADSMSQAIVYSNPSENKNKQITSFLKKAIRSKRFLMTSISEKNIRSKNEKRVKSVVTSPLVAHNKCYGAFAIAYGNEFGEGDLILINEYMGIAAMAIENALMFQEIESRRDELKLLTKQMLMIQEKERKLLASDIHDSLIQVMTGIAYKLQYCIQLSKREAPVLKNELNTLTHVIHKAIDQSRDMMTYLRPDLIDNIGLKAALKRLIENIECDKGMKITQNIRSLVNVSSDVRMCIYRIVQEALLNVYKHSTVRAAVVSLYAKNNEIVLKISDDGKGFDTAGVTFGVKSQKSLGLLFMKERVEAVNGEIHIYSSLNSGCKVEAYIPNIQKG